MHSRPKRNKSSSFPESAAFREALPRSSDRYRSHCHATDQTQLLSVHLDVLFVSVTKKTKQRQRGH